MEGGGRRSRKRGERGIFIGSIAVAGERTRGGGVGGRGNNRGEGLNGLGRGSWGVRKGRNEF